jgi:phosphoserine aminotransferase
MNIPFDVAGGDEQITRNFLIQAWEQGIVGLRTLTPFGVGKYLRASLYNGVSMDQVEVLGAFMADFLKRSRTQNLAAQGQRP